MATRYEQFEGYNKLTPATTVDEGANPTDPRDLGYLNDESLWVKYKTLIQRAINDTSVWRNNQDSWYKQRMRIKKKKIFPYEGCSNLKMPTDERQIRKKKAKLANRLFGVRPIVQATPPPGGNPQKSNKIEKFVDHLIVDVMGFYPKALIWLDKMLEGGFGINKVFWRTEVTKRQETFGLEDMSVQDAAMIFSHGTDPDIIVEEVFKRLNIDTHDSIVDENTEAVREAIVKLYAGADEVTIDVQDITYNAPDCAIPDTARVIVPVESPLDPNRCEWICHDLVIPYREFLARTQRGYKNIDKVNGLLTTSIDPNFPQEETKRFREGIIRYQTSGSVRLWEVYGWEKLTENDRAQRKCIMTFAPEFNVTLRRISLDLLDGQYPFSRINNEITDDRWYAPRGIPEIITDIVKEIDVQKNQRIDSQTSRNAPIYMYRVGIVNPNIKLRPNKGIPVPAGVPFAEAFQMMNNTNLNAEFSSNDEIQKLNAEVEELLGEINFTLQSQINKRQPRTGVEVDAQVQAQVPSSNLEGDIVADGFNDFVQKVFALWCKYGDDNYEFQYFGPGSQGQFETIKLTKEELQGHTITIRGNDGNTNPQVRLQKAQAVQNTVMNPIALQMGITTPANVYQAQRETLTQLGVNPDMFVSPPPPPPPPPTPPIKIGMEDLTPVEAIQVKQKMGIQPDVLGNLEMGIRDHQKHTMDAAKAHSDVVQAKHQMEMDQINAMQQAQINNSTPKENISGRIPSPTTQ